jgi:hypothetical protein
MENLVWVLPLLVCPLAMLLMGGVVWVAAKLGLRSPSPFDSSAGKREQHNRSVTAPEVT